MIIIMIIILIIMMMMIIIMIMITILIIIAWKGANRDFFFNNLLTAPQTVPNTYTEVAKAQSYANHVQYIRRSSRAIYRVPYGTKGQLSYEV